MRVVVLTNNNHPGANYILTKLPECEDIEVVGIISDCSLGAKNLVRHLPKAVFLMGVFFSLELLLVLFTIKLIGFIVKFFSKRKILLPKDVAKKYKIPHFKMRNINTKENYQIIKNLKPDLIISNYFNQIIKRDILEIPKKGAVNIHPGLLPAYRGIFSYFWCIFNNDKKAGVTIHEITHKIDKGEILALKKYKIKKKDTVTDLALKSGKIGFLLLKKTLSKMARGIKLQCKIPKIAPGYYNFPNREQFRKFYRDGKSLINLRSLIKNY